MKKAGTPRTQAHPLSLSFDEARSNGLINGPRFSLKTVEFDRGHSLRLCLREKLSDRKHPAACSPREAKLLHVSLSTRANNAARVRFNEPALSQIDIR